MCLIRVYELAVVSDVSGLARQQHLDFFLGADVGRPDELADGLELGLPSENSFANTNSCACNARFHKLNTAPAPSTKERGTRRKDR